MSKTIERLKLLPSNEILRDRDLRVFLVAILATIEFAPDYQENTEYKKLRNELEAALGDMSILEHELEEKFYSDLYVERVERNEIEEMTKLNRFILIHGLVGSGKTTILKRIKKNYEAKGANDIYFDFNLIPSEWLSLDESSFLRKCEKMIFDRLFEQCVQNFQLSRNFNIYVIRNDPNYTILKIKVDSIMNKSIISEKEWEEAFDNQEIRKRFNDIGFIPELDTLLEFLVGINPYIICFDNVDRLPIDLQRSMISFCDRTSKQHKITVLLAIREINLRRLKSESVNLRGSADHLADSTLINYLEKLEAGEEKDVSVNRLSDASIRALLELRMEFIQTHKTLSVFNGFLENFLQTYIKLNPESPSNVEEFNIRFWKIFDSIADTFIEGDIYKLCNHSIREMLIVYFNFVNQLMLNLEKEYSFKEIFYSEKSVRITKLRNYFYKFLMSNGSLVPTENASFPNIFQGVNENLSMIDLKILHYVTNFERRENHDNRLLFKEIDKTFNTFGITSDFLKERILFLSKAHGFNEMGYLILDGKPGHPINENTPVELQPAGDYFISTVSISREYVFWNCLFTDLPRPLMTNDFTYGATYSDAFKLEIIYKFIIEHLLPNLSTELDYCDKNILPADWLRSNIDFYNFHFSYMGRFYLDRLVESMLKVINYSDMPLTSKRNYEREYQNLHRQVKGLIKKFIPIY